MLRFEGLFGIQEEYRSRLCLSARLLLLLYLVNERFVNIVVAGRGLGFSERLRISHKGSFRDSVTLDSIRQRLRLVSHSTFALSRYDHKIGEVCRRARLCR